MCVHARVGEYFTGKFLGLPPGAWEWMPMELCGGTQFLDKVCVS